MNEHKLRHIFEPWDDRVLSIDFLGGDRFRLKRFSIVDFSVYGDPDKWTGEIVEAVAGSHPMFERLFKPGGGVDFVERDILRIRSDSTAEILFESDGVPLS